MRRALAGVFASGMVVACATDTFQGVDSGASNDGAACPNLAGYYSVSVNGPLCPTAPDPTICMKQTGCQLEVDGNAISGAVTLDASGGFTNGSIKEGASNRSGCTGTWNAGKSVLTINCGGAGTAQSCDVTLTLTSATCP